MASVSPAPPDAASPAVPVRPGGRWRRLVEREAESLGASTPSETEVAALSAVTRDAAKATQGVLLLLLSVVTYALIALGGVRDHDFYDPRASTHLPLLGADVAAGTFFAAMPLFAFALEFYLQIHLGHIQGFRRRLALAGAADQLDSPFPWFGRLDGRGGVLGSTVSALHGLIAWWSAPVVGLLYWSRLLVLRSTAHDWLWGNRLPAARVVGALAVGMVVVNSVWSAARRSVDHHFGIGPPLGRPGVAMRLVLVCAAGGAVLTQWSWIGRWRALDLRQAIVSQPPLEGLTGSTGARLAGARLDGANLSGAYLENADLSGASLRGANLAAANLRKARLSRADLEGATLTGAHLEQASLDETNLRAKTLREAHLEAAFLWRAQAEGGYLFGAHLEGAYLEEARFEGAFFFLAHLEGASLREGHFEGATFAGARLDGADLHGAHLEGAFFGAAAMELSLYTSAHLESVELEGARLQGADLEAARLGPATLPLAGEALSPSVAARLGDSSGVAADFAHAAAERVCGQSPPGSGWIAVADRAQCLSLRRETLRGLAKSSDAVRRLTESPPPWLSSTLR